MKTTQKCKKIGGLGVTQGHRQHSHSTERIRLTIRLQ